MHYYVCRIKMIFQILSLVFIESPWSSIIRTVNNAPDLWAKSGTAELASRSGTIELEKPSSFAIMGTKRSVKCMKNRIMIGFVIVTCHTFSWCSFWANLFFKSWFSSILHCLYAGFVPCPGDKLVVSDLITRGSEHCWWSLSSNYLTLYLKDQFHIIRKSRDYVYGKR